jgi:hypothetical protein
MFLNGVRNAFSVMGRVVKLKKAFAPLDALRD